MTAPITFEALESRQLASVSLGTNLLVNGTAEAGSATTDAKTTPDIPGWETHGVFSVVKYGSPGFLGTANVIPGDDGTNFFSGGRVGPVGQVALVPTASQTVGLAPIAGDVDAGRIRFDFSAYLGGFGVEKDTMNVQIEQKDAKGNILNVVNIAGPTRAQRNNQTGLVLTSATAAVPASTRFITVTMLATHEFGVVADGYADDLSLKLSSTAGTEKGFVSGTVFNDLNGDLRKSSSKEKGLAGITVFVDKDNDRKLDADELRAMTDASGAYTIANVPKGRAIVRMIAPAEFRASLSAVQSLRVNAGLTTIADPFAATQTSLITGRAVWQAARDDPSAQPIKGAAVFIDLNHNGKFDLTDPASMTDQTGAFTLTAPRGSCTILIDGYDGVAPLKVRVGKAEFSTGHVITIPPQ